MYNVLAYDEKICAMQQEDIKEVLYIERRSFISPWSKRLFEETISSPLSTNLIIKKGEAIISYFIMYYVADEVHILNLAVHPDYRHQGYGTKLLNYVLTNFKQEKDIEFFLEVRKSNSIAINLYRKFGFEIIGKRRRYYSETNEDALVMSFLRKGKTQTESHMLVL